MTEKGLNKSGESNHLMPLLFLGHGNPMNAIQENEFVSGFRNISKSIPKPAAVLCVSAHWETGGTFVTAMEKPRTIHDFGGFPKELYEVQYPAPGNPKLAREICSEILSVRAMPDFSWGLDHGTWSVVKHLYPDAGIPVLQLSLDFNKDPRFHYHLAKELARFRKEGVLIIGSGNIVHNLGIINWQNPDKGYDWANAANEEIKKLVLNNDHEKLNDYKKLGREIQQAIPTPDHFLPLLFVLGLKNEDENVFVFNDRMVFGSISMTSFLIT